MEKEKLLNKDDSLVIPFGKAVRVGNFKLWRGNYIIGEGKHKTTVECLYISSLDGAWMTRIPSTSPMFTTVCNGFATTDENLRNDFLGMIFTNVYNISNIPSEALHDAFYFLQEMMTFPYLFLPEKEMEKRMKENMKKLGVEKTKSKEHISQMVEYRRGLYELIERKKKAYLDEYERQQAEHWNAEDEEQRNMERDAIVDQAIDIINEEGED